MMLRLDFSWWDSDNPEWCRWLIPDDVEYLDSSNINGLNLYTYC